MLSAGLVAMWLQGAGVPQVAGSSQRACLHSIPVDSPALFEQRLCSLPSFPPSLPSCSATRQAAGVAAKNNLHPLQGGGSHQGVPPQEVLVVAWGLAGEFAAGGALPTEGWVFSAEGLWGDAG